jgi:hypothetical protein
MEALAMNPIQEHDTRAGAVTADAFLEALYGTNAPGYLVQSRFKPKKVYWHPAHDLEGVALKARQEARRSDFYFGLGLQPTKLDGGQRGGADTVIGVPAVYLELDWQHAAHKKSHLPPDRTAVLALLGEFALPPSILVDSSHGLHVYWLFPEPWTWEPGDVAQREDAHQLVVAVQTAVQRLAAAHGWTDVDSTHDLARVLRLPETLNHKDTPPTPVQVLDWHPERRYRRAELQAAAQKVLGDPATQPPGSRGGGTPAAPADVTPTERERLTVALAAASWPHKVPAHGDTPSRHNYLLGLCGFLTGHYDTARVVALVTAIAEQAGDVDFLSTRDWRGEIQRAAKDSARKRKANQRFRGFPKLAATFGGLGATLGALYPTQTWEMPGAAPTAARADACGNCGLADAVAQRDAKIAQLKAALARERAAHAETRASLTAANEALATAERKLPAQFVERFVDQFVELEKDPSTRGLALPLLVILKEHGAATQKWARVTPDAPDQPPAIAWRGDERSQQLGRAPNTLRKAIDYAEDHGIVSSEYKDLGRRADGDWRRERHLRLVADLPDDLPDALWKLRRLAHERREPRERPKRSQPCEACVTAQCTESGCDAPLEKTVSIACTVHGEVVPTHVHHPQRPSTRPRPAVLHFRRPRPGSERKTCAPTSKDVGSKFCVPNEEHTAAAAATAAVIDRLLNDEELATLSPKEAIEYKLAVLRAAAAAAQCAAGSPAGGAEDTCDQCGEPLAPGDCVRCGACARAS